MAIVIKTASRNGSCNLDDQANARAAFEQAWPDHASTQHLDELRQTDYGRLDQLGHVYLDYTGGSLYSATQVRRHMEQLQQGVFGNPHSANPASRASTQSVAAARASVHQFFHASPEEYAVIFTANASGSLKLVGEAYPFTKGSRYLLTAHRGRQGTMGLFDATEPWGPWTTVAYEDNWLELRGTGLGREMLYINLPTRWIADRGRTLWAVFSGGQDQFLLVKGTLGLRK